MNFSDKIYLPLFFCVYKRISFNRIMWWNGLIERQLLCEKI